jgi:hypothetical protein
MGIDRKTEQTTRTMLGYAIWHELDASEDTIQLLTWLRGHAGNPLIP